MEFKNAHYLKKEEKDSILDFIHSTCEKFNVSTGDLVGLEMNTHLKTTSGKIKFYFKEDLSNRFDSIPKRIRSNSVPYNIKDVSLHFSVRLYKEYGFETLMGTVAHELAHYIVIQQSGDNTHSISFKKVCVAIGGHMNHRIAGQDFKEAATSQFCVTKKKWRYTCKCGSKETTRKYAEHTLDRYRCRVCKTYRRDMKLERI